MEQTETEKRQIYGICTNRSQRVGTYGKGWQEKFVRYQEGAELYSMGLHTFEELAKEAGAIYKIRRVVLVNLEIFEEYLDTFRM